MKQIFLFLQLVIFVTSFNAQTQPNSKGVVTETKTISATQSKIKKGTNQYAAVNFSLQDKAGNLWFSATGQGVYCYDGKSFRNFTEKDGLISNNVYCMLEDKTGNIWFGTKTGACRYDGKTFTDVVVSASDSSNFYPFTGKAVSGSQKEIYSILQDKNGEFWFGTNKGVFRYNGKFFTHFLDNDGVINKDGLILNHATDMLEDKAGNIWFTTWFEGLCRYDGKSIICFKPFNEVWFACIMEDKNGNIWIGSRIHGAYRYDGKSFTNFLDTKIFNSCCIYSMAEDKTGNIWFGAEFDDMATRDNFGGVWRYDGKSFKNYTTKDGLTHNAVFSLTIDKVGNIWLGTRNTGLCRYDGKTFTNFSE